MIKAVSVLLTFLISIGSVQAIMPKPTGTAAVRAASADVSESTGLLSPGIAVVAASERMVVSAKKGGEAVFEVADFEAAVGVSALEYITLTALPDSAAGRLQIGSLALAKGQSVSRLNISRMAFVPAGAELENAGFSFSVNGGAHSYDCTVNFTDEKNTAPVLGTATAALLSGATYSGMPTAGRLAAYDADGDALFFSLTAYPRHGSVIITDRAAGSYLYIPEDGFSGRDSFSYTVRDERGARADDFATVSITVSRRGGREGFADMSGSVFESTAVRVSDAGIMGGTEVGSKTYFYPDRTVSRSEFIVMAMTAARIRDLPACEKTVFADDADISASARPYVDAVYRLGICDGWIKDGKQCFLPDETITVAEAMVIAAGLLEIKTDGVAAAWCADDSVPAWAAAGYGTMRAAGFVGAGVGGSARDALDRRRCADLVAAIMRYSSAKR